MSYQRRPRESHPVSSRAEIRTCAYTDSYSFSAFIMEGFSLPLNVVEVYHSETFIGESEQTLGLVRECHQYVCLIQAYDFFFILCFFLGYFAS